MAGAGIEKANLKPDHRPVEEARRHAESAPPPFVHRCIGAHLPPQPQTIALDRRNAGRCSGE